MELNFESLSLTIASKSTNVPNGLTDHNLFIIVKNEIEVLLSNPLTEIIDFGLTPDNDADGQEELLLNGVFYRIAAYDKYLPIDDNSEPQEILKAFLFLIQNYDPFWCTIFCEEIGAKKQTTIEILYKEL